MTCHPIFKSLLREQTFLGCERPLCMMLIFVCMIFGLYSFSLAGSILALASAFAGWLFLVRMAREDLKYRYLFMRNIRYSKYYLAQSQINSKVDLKQR